MTTMATQVMTKAELEKILVDGRTKLRVLEDFAQFSSNEVELHYDEVTLGDVLENYLNDVSLEDVTFLIFEGDVSIMKGNVLKQFHNFGKANRKLIDFSVEELSLLEDFCYWNCENPKVKNLDFGYFEIFEFD